MTIDFRMTSTDAVLRRRAARGDLVREARPLHHGHAPVRALVQPGDRPAVGDAHRLRRLRRRSPSSSPSSPPTISAPATTSSPCRCCTTRPTSMATAARGGAGLEGGRGASRCPGRTMPKLVVVERDYGAVAREDGRARPAGRAASAPPPRACAYDAASEVDIPARTQRRRRMAASADGRPVAGDATSSLAEAILAPVRAPPTGTSPSRGSSSWSSAPACGSPTWPPSTRASGSPSPTPRSQPVPVITSPEWSGSETGGRRYSPFTINVERHKPWHTLTGRQHFYLDHDWMLEIGEGLPVYRPPLNMTALFGEPGIGERRRARGHGALPHPAQQVVDPLRVPGQPVHALAVPRRPDDLDEPTGTPPRSGSRTTTGSRRSTATASSSPGRS